MTAWERLQIASRLDSGTAWDLLGAPADLHPLSDTIEVSVDPLPFTVELAAEAVIVDLCE
jgi:hypothetical protein